MTNETNIPEAAQEQFFADTGYDWTDPAGEWARKIWLKARASFEAAPRGTDAQILKERELTAAAIDGAMAFGYQGSAPPPDEAAWLRKFYDLGKAMAEKDRALALPITAPGAEVVSDAEIDALHDSMFPPAVVGKEKVRAFVRTALARFGAQPAAATHQQGLQVAEGLLEYAMQIAHERELQVLGNKHDSEGAIARFRSAVNCALAATPLQSPTPLPEAQPVSDNGASDALGYATRLAQALHAKHFPEVTQWRPLPDVLGLLTQIDNMTCGLVEPKASQAHGKSGAAATTTEEPCFYAAFAWYQGGGEGGWIALPGYSNETEHGVKNLILEAARKEGYKGTVTGRLMELGWEIRPVFDQPQAAAPASVPGAPVAGGSGVTTLRAAVAQVLGWYDEARAGTGWPTHVDVRDTLAEAIAAAPVPKAPDAEKDAARGPMTKAPEFGTPYWYIRDSRLPSVACGSWDNAPSELEYLKAGRLFRTEKDARAALQAEAQKTGGAA